MARAKKPPTNGPDSIGVVTTTHDVTENVSRGVVGRERGAQRV